MKSFLIYFLCFWSFVGFAQKQSINYDQIFSTSHTYVGLPQGDSLRIFGTQQGKWKQHYSFKIPENTVAIDGNERRVFFLTDKEMIVQEYYACSDMCDRDTLLLSDVEWEIKPKHWIRHISSTEKDFAYFASIQILYLFKDSDGWNNKKMYNPFAKIEKRDPKFYLDMPYQKISIALNEAYVMTQENQELKFWLFDPQNLYEQYPQMKKELIPSEKLAITLPKEVLSVFAYDMNEIAWVYKDRIEFYQFDKEKSTWIKSLTPALKFENLK